MATYYRVICEGRRRACRGTEVWGTPLRAAAKMAAMVHNLTAHEGRGPAEGWRLEAVERPLPEGIEAGTPLALRPVRL